MTKVIVVEITGAQNSMKLTTKHLTRKQVKHMAVTDPTCSDNHSLAASYLGTN